MKWKLNFLLFFFVKSKEFLPPILNFNKSVMGIHCKLSLEF